MPLTAFEQSLKDSAERVFVDVDNDGGAKFAVYAGGHAGVFIENASSDGAKYCAKIVNQSAPCGVVGMEAVNWGQNHDPVYGSGMEIDVAVDVFIRGLRVDLGVAAQQGYSINTDGLNVNNARMLYLYDALIQGSSDSALDLKAPALVENTLLHGGFRLARIRKPTTFVNCQFTIPPSGFYFLEMLGTECEVFFHRCTFTDAGGIEYDTIPMARVQRDNTPLNQNQLAARIHYTDVLPNGMDHPFFVQARGGSLDPQEDLAAVVALLRAEIAAGDTAVRAEIQALKDQLRNALN